MPSTSEIIADYYRFLRERDHESLVALLDENIVVTYHARAGNLPWAGRYEGIAGFDQFFSIIREYLDIVEVTIVDSLESGGRFVNFCEGKWKYRESGHIVEGHMVNGFTVVGGRITAYDVYADTAAFAEGLDSR